MPDFPSKLDECLDSGPGSGNNLVYIEEHKQRNSSEQRRGHIPCKEDIEDKLVVDSLGSNILHHS